MAQIRMDVTEYNALLKVQANLEESLSREKELSRKVDSLQQEKIDLLENNKMKVTIKNKRMVTQRYVASKTDMARELINQLIEYAKRIESMRGLYRENRDVDAVEYYINQIFDKVSVETIEEDSNVTMKGLDEVKAEITATLKKELDETTIKKLEFADTAMARQAADSEQIKSLQKTVNSFSRDNSFLRKELDSLAKENEGLTEENDKLKKYQEIIEQIKSVIPNESVIGSWNKRDLLTKILTLIRQQ